jgi:hypothetical protein
MSVSGSSSDSGSAMAPLDVDSLGEIREIFAKIDLGEYQHDQKLFGDATDCGTPHCIAGWKAVRDFNKGLIPADVARSSFCQMVYARHAWGLTFWEATKLFGANSTREQQDALVLLWESGRRLETLDEGLEFMRGIGKNI